MSFFGAAPPGLLYAVAWIFLFGFLMASRHLSLRVAFGVAALKVAIPLVYFAFEPSGVLHLRDDVEYFQDGLRLLQAGLGPLSVFTDPRGLIVLFSTAGTSQHFIYYLWNLLSMKLFGPDYFSAVFLNVGVTFVSGWFFYRILACAGFSPRYRRAALVFFLLHWDVVAWSSFLNLKDTLVVAFSLAMLYNAIRFLRKPGLMPLAAFAALAVPCYFLRFYVPLLIAVAVALHYVLERRDWIKAGAAVAVAAAACLYFDMLRWLPAPPSPVEFLAGWMQFLVTPLPWNLSDGYGFLFLPASLHLLLLVPALLAIPSLWKRDSSLRFLFVYLLLVTLMFALVPDNRGIRQRQMVDFLFVLMQFSALRGLLRYVFPSAEPTEADRHPTREPGPGQEAA